MAWSGGLSDWVEGDTAFVSVVFSWKLPEAYQRCAWYKQQGYSVKAGGPATYILPKYLSAVADVGGSVEALIHHNPIATVASRGCPEKCYFCIVSRMEGEQFTLLPNFTPRPILMDNNLSGLPVEYQEYIISKYLKAKTMLTDAQSGFEPSTFDVETYRRWSKINNGPWRFAFDTTSEEEEAKQMATILKDVSASKKRVYVLIGNEPISSCYERVQKVIEWGCEPHCQPYMALNTLEKRPKVAYDWTEQKLHDMARWANRWIWRSVPIGEYKPRKKERATFALDNL